MYFYNPPKTHDCSTAESLSRANFYCERSSLRLCFGISGFQCLSGGVTAPPALNRAMSSASTKNIAVVGGGPVGALAALYFARYFEKVTLYELRAGIIPLSLNSVNSADPRIPANKNALPNKSINLALSDRGIKGIRGISDALAEEIVGTTIPMRGRCLHDRAGRQVTQFYDTHGRVWISCDNELIAAQQFNGQKLA